MHKYAIKPVQQFAFTSGKNATDSALIIDAMDLLYTHRFGGFCIVSSDSYFKLKPDFDSRLYGFKKLSDLVKGKPEIFETEERVNPGSNTK